MNRPSPQLLRSFPSASYLRIGASFRPAHEFALLDLRRWENCRTAVAGAIAVYNLAANMGGIGFIEGNKALCMLSVLVSTHVLQAAHECGVERAGSRDASDHEERDDE